MRKNSRGIVYFVLFVMMAGLPVYLYSLKGNSNHNTVSTIISEDIVFSNDMHTLYNEIGLNETNLEFKVFYKAMVGYLNLKSENKLSGKQILSIADFSKPSTEDRLFVIDLEQKKILFHTLVSHGRGTGENIATAFSNTPNSFMSSLGFYTTAEIYNGAHDYSLKLDGQETGINDKARERGIVMHAADYVSKDFVQAVGRLGRSQGCPAVSKAECKPIINTIAEGTCFFIYHTDKKYTKNSRILKNEKLAYAEFNKVKSEQTEMASLEATEQINKVITTSILGAILAD